MLCFVRSKKKDIDFVNTDDAQPLSWLFVYEIWIIQLSKESLGGEEIFIEFIYRYVIALFCFVYVILEEDVRFYKSGVSCDPKKGQRNKIHK